MTPRRWTWIALALFAGAAALQFHEVWRAGARTAIAAPRPGAPERGAAPERFDALWSPWLGALRKGWEEPDHAFALWVVTHNARAWLGEQPLLGPGQCFPFAKPLLLGHPALTQGLLAAPGYGLLRDPIAAYNVMLFAIVCLSALAMFSVVREWTASPAAALAAGLLFAFHGAWTSLSTYPFLVDLAWTLWALWFAGRAIESGRARDACAAALCVVLQLASSLYAGLVAALVLGPFGIALVAKRRRGRLTLPVIVAAAALALSGALALASLYVGLPASDEPRPRFVAAWQGFVPGGYVGWLAAGLAVFAFVPAGAGRDGWRRWPLLASCALALWFATGGDPETRRVVGGGAAPLGLPDPYRLFGFVPGIDLVRGPAWLASGVHLALTLLAGLGAARALALVPPARRGWAGALLCAVVAVDTLAPQWTGGRAPSAFSAVSLRPDAERLALLREVAGREPGAVVLEVPLAPRSRLRGSEAGRLVEHVHHRMPTSSCHNSVTPPETARVRELAARLPDPEALAELRALGFTTLLVHGQTAARRRLAGPGVKDGSLEPLGTAPWLAAYAIR